MFLDYKELLEHVGHKISCIAYEAEHEYEGDPPTVALECETCGIALDELEETA